MAATDIPADSSGSLGGLSLSDDEDIECDDEALQSDTWIEELECALLADCDPATLKKICEGKRIPASLRPDYWRTLLALNDAGKVKLTNEFDLPNQDELRHDCEQLVEDISANLSPEPLPESDKLRMRSDFESTMTTYVKARPELHYVSGNGWTDILKVLYNLRLNDEQMYQMFFRIVDRYIPKDLSPPPPSSPKRETDSNKVQDKIKEASNNNKNNQNPTPSSKGKTPQESAISEPSSNSKQASNSNDNKKIVKNDKQQQRKDYEKSIQAYHLLRLLIQYHDPELCSILDSKKVTPSLYVKDWFCSLFAKSCPPKLALHIWDMHFKMADPFLIFFAAIVMVVNASDELKKSNLSQADMLNALKKMPSLLEEDDVEDLYYLVSNHYTNSTPRSIRSYSHLFFMDTFGATYSGNESPELTGSAPLVDLKTCRLTSSLDLSQHLCLPIVPAEIFALDTAQQRSSPVSPSGDEGSTESDSPSRTTNTALRYFLVDCRPAEQYNAGHLTKAFHLDCSLMLREPSSFATAVQALLEIQRQVVASKSNTGGQHLCFIGSGQDEEDRYVNMVVASFLQKCQKYVSIVYGGFDAIHDYVKTKSELRDSFDKYIVDHNEALCKTCCSNCPEALERLKLASSLNQQIQSSNSFAGGLSSAQSLLASTTGFFRGDKSPATNALNKFASSNPQATATAQQLAYSGASIFDKFTTAFVSKSSVIKDRLVETINNASLPSPTLTAANSLSGTRGHVSSQDRLGPRYTGGNNYNYADNSAGELLRTGDHSALLGGKSETISEEPCQEIQIDQWQKDNEIMAIFKCSQIKGAHKYPGYVGINKTHLWILREIPHNKGFASIAAKRPLDMVVQITSKRRQPDLIIFRYGYSNKDKPPAGTDKAGPVGQSSTLTTVASDHLHIPQAFEVIRVIKREVVRIMDERGDISRQAQKPAPPPGPEVQPTEPPSETPPSETPLSEAPPSEAPQPTNTTEATTTPPPPSPSPSPSPPPPPQAEQETTSPSSS